MPAPARKAVATKKVAANAARREVRSERGPKAKPFVVHFRGEQFEVTRDRLGTDKVYQRQVMVDVFRSNDSVLKLVYEIIGPRDAGRFLALCKPGEVFEPAAEFLEALNKVASTPNS